MGRRDEPFVLRLSPDERLIHQGACEAILGLRAVVKALILDMPMADDFDAGLAAGFNGFDDGVTAALAEIDDAYDRLHGGGR